MRTLGRVFAILFLLGVAWWGLFAMLAGRDAGEWRPYAETVLSSALGMPVRIEGAVRVVPNPVTPGLAMENVVIGDGLARIDRLEVEAWLIPLLQRRIDVSRIRLLGGTVTLDAAGATNFGGAAPTAASLSAFASAPPEIAGRDLVLVVRDAAGAERKGQIAWFRIRAQERDLTVRAECRRFGDMVTTSRGLREFFPLPNGPGAANNPCLEGADVPPAAGPSS